MLGMPPKGRIKFSSSKRHHGDPTASVVHWIGSEERDHRVKHLKTMVQHFEIADLVAFHVQFFKTMRLPRPSAANSWRETF